MKRFLVDASYILIAAVAAALLLIVAVTGCLWAKPTPPPPTVTLTPTVYFPTVTATWTIPPPTETPTPWPTNTPAPIPTSTPTPVVLDPGWKGLGASYYPDFCKQGRVIVGEDGWMYNWGPWPGTLSLQGHQPGDFCEVDFIPAVAKVPEGECPELWPSEYVLIGNEPITQYDMTSAEFADHLYRGLQCYPDRIPVIIGEAETSLAQSILLQYSYKYGALPINTRLAFHCYGNYSPENAVDRCVGMIDLAQDLARSYGIVGVWMTEYGYPPCWSDMESSAWFIEEITLYALDAGVERMSPFQLYMTDQEPWSFEHWKKHIPEARLLSFGEFCSTKLIEDDGSLNVIGEAYRNVSPN